MAKLEICIADEQATLALATDRLRSAIATVLKDAGVRSGEISLALVDDATMHRLNRQFLEHDYTTDVLSFVLDHEGDALEAELIVCTDFAQRSAEQYGWPAADEVLLYVVHGALHLVGYDDVDPEEQARMRERERHYLGQFGVEARY